MGIDCRQAAGYRGWLIIDLHETRIRTVKQMRAILEGTETSDFVPATSAHARCAWSASVLGRLHYRQMTHPNRGLVLRYPRCFCGFGRVRQPACAVVAGSAVANTAVQRPVGAGRRLNSVS